MLILLSLLLWVGGGLPTIVDALDASGPFEAIYFYSLYQVEFRMKGLDAQIAPGLSQYLTDYANSHNYVFNENEPRGLARFGEFVWYITGNSPKSLEELDAQFPANQVNGAMIAREKPKLLLEEPKEAKYKNDKGVTDKETFDKDWKKWKTRFDQMHIDAGQKKLAMNPRDQDFIGYTPRTDPAAESRYNTAKPGKIKFQLNHISSSGSGDRGIAFDTAEASKEYINVFEAVGERIGVLQRLDGFRNAANLQSLDRANDALRTVLNLRTRDSKTKALDKRIMDTLKQKEIGPLPLPSQPKPQADGSKGVGGAASSRENGEAQDEDYVRRWRYDSANGRSSLEVDIAALERWFHKPGVGVTRKPGETVDDWHKRDVEAKTTVLDISDSHTKDPKTKLHDDLIIALRAQSETLVELRSICHA